MKTARELVHATVGVLCREGRHCIACNRLAAAIEARDRDTVEAYARAAETGRKARRGRSRKPETLPPRDHLDAAESYLKLAARHIDTAGDLAGTDQADMLACYASNVLQGSLALIRELRRSLRDARGSK